MTQVRTDILLNGTRLEIHPSKLTKCGEIHINDDCTSAYLFCAFCSVGYDDPDVNIFRTLAEFIDHIRWHRSDDLQYPQSPTSPKETTKELYETIEDDSRSNLSVPRHDAADDIADWIAPPEELFELNTISNLIEIDTPNETIVANPVANDVRSQDVTLKYINCTTTPPTAEFITNATTSTMEIVEEEGPDAPDEEIPEITGEVFINLLDLFKKCPCLWHHNTAAKTKAEMIECAYKLLASHYNKCAQQNRPVEYVKNIITQVRDDFLEEQNGASSSASAENSPWYFPHLHFLLSSDSDELDESLFTDFLCPVCKQERNSIEDLWKHLTENHFDTNNNDSFGNAVASQNDNGHSIPLSQYPMTIVEKFIEIYRSQTRLWDRKNDEYNSRALRRQSYDLLVKILREHDPTSNRADVVKKINHLRSQFIYEREKSLSPKSSATRSNRSWFYDKLKFLANNVTKRPAIPCKPANFKRKVRNAKCPICSTTFTDHSSWLSHMQSAHTSDEYQAKDGYFYCAICGWQNKTKEILMRHLRTRHTYNLHKCTDCNIGFRLLSMLVEHRAKVHNDNLAFKCETCNEGFATRTSLRTHSTTHWCKDDLPHKCEHCGAKFSDRDKYNVHVRQHNSDDEHRCDICQQIMSTKTELRNHIKTHSDVCPHMCGVCERAYPTVKLLTAHMTEEHGGTVYSCEKCDKTFKTPKTLSDHYECHQTQSECDVCGVKFFRKQSLRKHKRLKHDTVPYDYLM